MEALNNPLFSNVLGNKILKSDNTIQEKSNQMSSKIFEMSFQKNKWAIYFINT